MLAFDHTTQCSGWSMDLSVEKCSERARVLFFSKGFFWLRYILYVWTSYFSVIITVQSITDKKSQLSHHWQPNRKGYQTVSIQVVGEYAAKKHVCWLIVLITCHRLFAWYCEIQNQEDFQDQKLWLKFIYNLVHWQIYHSRLQQFCWS